MAWLMPGNLKGWFASLSAPSSLTTLPDGEFLIDGVALWVAVEKKKDQMCLELA